MSALVHATRSGVHSQNPTEPFNIVNFPKKSLKCITILRRFLFYDNKINVDRNKKANEQNLSLNFILQR